jgi:predicted nucleic acid-binding protein
VIYLDSAALVKLIHPEPATAELLEWLGERPGVSLVSSALVEVEVPRALRRRAPARLAAVGATLAQLARVEPDAKIRTAAAAIADPHLRSLDAIHLATALQLAEELDSFVSYDHRLLHAAGLQGLPIASPGG